MTTSAESRVIAAFTFIVALLLGAWSGLDYLLTEPSSLISEPEIGGLVVALLPFAATAVAFHATKSTEAAWARSLGGAAVMLGVLTCLGGVLYFASNF